MNFCLQSKAGVYVSRYDNILDNKNGSVCCPKQEFMIVDLSTC